MTEIHKSIKVICFITAKIVLSIELGTYNLGSESRNLENNIAISYKDSSTSINDYVTNNLLVKKAMFNSMKIYLK